METKQQEPWLKDFSPSVDKFLQQFLIDAGSLNQAIFSLSFPGILSAWSVKTAIFKESVNHLLRLSVMMKKHYFPVLHPNLL